MEGGAFKEASEVVEFGGGCVRDGGPRSSYRRRGVDRGLRLGSPWLTQRLQERKQGIVVEFVHQGQKLAQFARRKALPRNQFT